MRWMAVMMMMRLMMIISIRRSRSRRSAMSCEGDGRDEGGVPISMAWDELLKEEQEEEDDDDDGAGGGGDGVLYDGLFHVSTEVSMYLCIYI